VTDNEELYRWNLWHDDGIYLITAMFTGAEAVASYTVDMVDWMKEMDGTMILT